MSDPAWSQAFILQDGANFTFPNYQTCTHANTGSCQITALSAIKSTSGWTYYEVHCTVGSSTTYIGVGFLAQAIALQTTQNIRANPSQGSCSWVEDHSGGASGGVYNNGSEVLSGPNLPNPTFVIGVLVNGTEGIWGYTVDGTNWNGTNTAAQIVAGTGAITMGYAGPYLPFVSAQDYEGSNVAFTASIYASSANCTYALPTGASYLAASPILTVSSATCLPGDAVQIDWTAANTPVPAGLNYLLDSGSPTACSGSVTGTAGTAIGPMLSSGFHSIAIQDPASLSESNLSGFYVTSPPSGAGTLVYESSGTSLSSVGVTFTVDLPEGFAFDFYMQAQSTSGTIQLTGGNDFGISATGTQVPNYTTGGGFSNPALPDYTPQLQNGWIGVAPATGPTYVSVTTTTSVQGSVSLVDGTDGAGTLTATITNNGSVSTYSHVVTNYAPLTNGLIDSSTIFPGHDTTYSYYLAVYAPSGPPDNLYASQVVEQVLASIPDYLLVSQAVEQVLLSLPQFNRVGLFQTDATPTSETEYIEFGNPMSWFSETSLLPDNQEVSNNGMIVTTLDLAFVGSSPVVAVQAIDAAGDLITQSAVVSAGTDTIWDTAVWDVDVWDGTPSPLSPWQIPWTQSVVFRQMQFSASGYSFAGFRIGNLYMQFKQLGYVAQLPSGAR
jgi:hypothetical protein